MYEYLVENYRYYNDIEKDLNDKGEDGWKLHSLIVDRDGTYIAIFEHEYEEDEED